MDRDNQTYKYISTHKGENEYIKDKQIFNNKLNKKRQNTKSDKSTGIIHTKTN